MRSLSESEYEALLKKAKRTNQQRDRHDRKVGFAAPGDASLRVYFRTVLSALEAGMRMEDWPCVAEGYVMLQDFYARLESMAQKASAAPASDKTP